MNDFDEMEMPVPCDKCGEWVELTDCRTSELTKKLLCRDCCDVEDEVKAKIDEIKDIQYMLDNNDEEVRGDRRGWKRNIKDLKKEIIELGYDPEELLY